MIKKGPTTETLLSSRSEKRKLFFFMVYVCELQGEEGAPATYRTLTRIQLGQGFTDYAPQGEENHQHKQQLYIYKEEELDKESPAQARALL